jgi:CheY-like chemotaxis protein
MIVVVNDELRVRETLHGVLERAGYEVRAFARGEDALEAIAWPTVELVISERTNFPMNGIEFLRRVRERLNVPVVFVSAWAQELQQGDGERCGAEAVGDQDASETLIEPQLEISDFALEFRLRPSGVPRVVVVRTSSPQRTARASLALWSGAARFLPPHRWSSQYSQQGCGAIKRGAPQGFASDPHRAAQRGRQDG